jgi:hypothetical protein
MKLSKHHTHCDTNPVTFLAIHSIHNLPPEQQAAVTG